MRYCMESARQFSIQATQEITTMVTGSTIDQPIAVSVPRASRMAGVSARRIWTAIAARDLRSLKLGRRRLVRLADLDRWLESHATGEAR